MMRTWQIQGFSWVLTRYSALAIIIAFGLSWAALNATTALAGQDENSEATVETRQMRKDNVFGTTDEGIRTGRDPNTGDTVITVTPPEKPKQPEYPLPPVLVEPKVEVPANKKP